MRKKKIAHYLLITLAVILGVLVLVVVYVDTRKTKKKRSV